MSSTGPLERAARWWLRRGYALHYGDEHLVQLVRGAGVGWEALASLAAALVLCGIALAFVRRSMRRSWHVVTLAVTPDNRIITHRIWTRHLPEQ